MKIEIKPFNTRVRFIPAITFKRPEKRTSAARPAHCFFGKPLAEKF